MRYNLEGYDFSMLTNHQSLKWLITLESPTNQVALWCLYLQQFDFKIVYRKGTLNKVAEVLSCSNEIQFEKKDDNIQETTVVSSTKIKES